MEVPLNSSRVLSTLLQYQSGALPAAEAMRRLGLDWRGDLLRWMAAYDLTPPMGGHAASGDALALADDLLAVHTGRGSRRTGTHG